MVEVNASFKEVPTVFGSVMITPPLDAGYFIARVPLFQDQAIVCFPKFGTIGCGFAQEEDWNTNLPLGLDAERIYSHIKHNKKYAEISDEQCLNAIRELQTWLESVTRAAEAAGGN